MSQYLLDTRGILSPLTRNKQIWLERVIAIENEVYFTEEYRTIGVVSLLKMIGRQT
jgi:hypothetical protein